MNHRTYGETRNCKGCRYWSEMLAHTVDGGVQAMCLSRMRYTSGYNTCMFGLGALMVLLMNQVVILLDMKESLNEKHIDYWAWKDHLCCKPKELLK